MGKIKKLSKKFTILALSRNIGKNIGAQPTRRQANEKATPLRAQKEPAEFPSPNFKVRRLAGRIFEFLITKLGTTPAFSTGRPDEETDGAQRNRILQNATLCQRNTKLSWW